MYAQTRLLNGFYKTLTYRVPEHLSPDISAGSLVQVPLKNKKVLAYVTEIIPYLAASQSYTIKEVIALVPFPFDAHYQMFLEKLSTYYARDPLFFINRLQSFLKQKEGELKHAYSLPDNHQPSTITLTAQQEVIAESLKTTLTQPIFRPTLLYGVTGSGKTEIYKALIVHALKNNKSVIILVPEVTLAVQFSRLLKQQLPAEIMLYSFHCATSAQEKQQLWQSLNHQKPVVILGVHLPVMLPTSNLGLIIVDEEHEIGYQEKKHPKINTKEAALLRAQEYQIPILLGSATPSITSLYQVQQKRWELFHLKERFAGAFPSIKIIELLKDAHREFFWLSTVLEREIRDRLARRQQCILFLNRRGYSFFVICKQCGFVFSCSSCSVSLTLHDDNSLRCHYCNYRMHLPSVCTACNAPEKDLLKKGIGTQQLATVVEQLFPHARVGRADLDSTINKKKWQHTLETFQKGDLDILVGTQMITKGYHFPRVTLVGIIWADANIHFPRYNATETTLQQLIQVAGRAGRQTAESLVVVQTLVNHPAFEYIDETKYLDFHASELEKRKACGYPPFARLAEIEIRSENEQLLNHEAQQLARSLDHCAKKNKYQVTVLGPALPPVAKIKNIYSRVIYLKSPSTAWTRKILLEATKDAHYTCTIYFTPTVVT